MKRLTWLLLAVFCTALVQIQPAQGAPVKAKACACCQQPGDCGTTECCPPAAFAAVALGAEASEQLTPAAARSERAVRSVALFYASFVEPAALRRALPASAEAAAAATVPLFKVHCCFLI